jgi:hypothetical protein
VKQYDKIWVPCDDPTDYEVCRIETGNPLKGWVDAEEKVIVCDVEELLEAMQAAYDLGKNGHLSKIIDFKSYLQSKGISIH